MPNTLFISTGSKSQQAERALMPALIFANTLAETLNQKQAKSAYKSAYVLQGMYHENEIFQFIKDHTIHKDQAAASVGSQPQPILYLMLDSERDACCLSPEKLLQFKYQGGKIIVSVFGFDKHRFDSYKLHTLSYINLADGVIFSEKEDKESAEKAALHYYPAEKRLKNIIAEACIFPAFPKMPYLARVKPAQRGRDIVFQGELRSGVGMAHVQHLAKCIAKSTEPAVKDKTILILGTISDDTQYNRVLKDLMQGMYPTEAAECQNKNAAALKKLLLEFQRRGLKPVLPIELHLNPSQDALPALYDRISYCFLPLHGGAKFKEACFPQALQQQWIIYSHLGYETDASLKPEGALSQLFILRENDEYNTYAPGVLADIENREKNLKLNDEMFDRLQKYSQGSPAQEIVLAQHLAFYEAWLDTGKGIDSKAQWHDPKDQCHGPKDQRKDPKTECQEPTDQQKDSNDIKNSCEEIKIKSEDLPLLIHSFRSWRDMPLPRKYAVLQEARSHAQLNRIKGIPLSSRSEANYKALLKRLRDLEGPYTDEMRTFLSPKKGVLTLEERRFIKALLAGPWKFKHVTEHVKVITEKGNQLLALEERKRRTESIKNSNTPGKEGHTNNVFMSFGPGDIETVRFLDHITNVVESNFKHLLGDETPRNVEPDPYALHGFWSSDHFFAYGAEQIGEPVIIYGTHYQVNYRKIVDETNNTTRFTKECHFTPKSGKTLTQTMELGDEIFTHPRLDIALLLLTIEKIRFLGKEAWTEIMQETDLKVLQRIVQTFYHTGVLEVHKPEQFLIDQPGVDMNTRVAKPRWSGDQDSINKTSEASSVLQAAARGDSATVLKAVEGGLSLDKNIALPSPNTNYYLPILGAAILGGQLELIQTLLEKGLDLNINLNLHCGDYKDDAPSFTLNNYLDCALVATDPQRVQDCLKLVLGTAPDALNGLDIKKIAEKAVQILKLFFEQGTHVAQNKKIQHLMPGPNQWHFPRLLSATAFDPDLLQYLFKMSHIPAKHLPLATAAYFGTIALVEQMLARGAEINQKYSDQNHPLNKPDGTPLYPNLKEGYTSLFIAILKKNRPLMELLLKHGAEINTPCYVTTGAYGPPHNTLRVEDPQGFTPLMLAVEQEFREGIDLLLKHGAKITPRSVTGKTAISLAKKAGREDILQQLLQPFAGSKGSPLTQSIASHGVDRMDLHAPFFPDSHGTDIANDLGLNEKGESAYDLYPALLNAPGIPIERQAERFKLYDHKIFVIPMGRLPSGERFILLDAIAHQARSFLPFDVETLMTFSKKEYQREFDYNSDLKVKQNQVTWKVLGQGVLGLEEAGVHDASQFLCYDLGEMTAFELSALDVDSYKAMMESTWRRFHKDPDSLRKEYQSYFFSELIRVLMDALLLEKTHPMPSQSALSFIYSQTLNQQYRLLKCAKEGDIKGMDEILRRGIEPNYATPTVEASTYTKDHPGNDFDRTQRITPFQMALIHEKWDAALFVLEAGQLKINHIYNFVTKMVAAGQLKLLQALKRLECWDMQHNLSNFLDVAIQNSRVDVIDFLLTLLKEDPKFQIDFYEKLKYAANNLFPEMVKYFLTAWQNENSKKDAGSKDHRTLKDILRSALSHARSIYAGKDHQGRTQAERDQAFLDILDILLPLLDNKNSSIYYLFTVHVFYRDDLAIFKRLLAWRDKETYSLLVDFQPLRSAVLNQKDKILRELFTIWLQPGGQFSEFTRFIDFCNGYRMSVDKKSAELIETHYAAVAPQWIAFKQALEAGDISAIRKMLSDGLDINMPLLCNSAVGKYQKLRWSQIYNYSDQDKFYLLSPLKIALYHEHKACAEFLIEKGAKVEPNAHVLLYNLKIPIPVSAPVVSVPAPVIPVPAVLFSASPGPGPVVATGPGIAPTLVAGAKP